MTFVGLRATGSTLAPVRLPVLPRKVSWYITGTLAGLGVVWAAYVLAFTSLTQSEDALAYWRAGRNLIAGVPIYALHPGAQYAYEYPPIVAQLLAPAAFLPDWAFVWLMRAFGLVGLRVAVGSWRRAGIALLVFPPVLLELSYANVNLLVAGAVAATMRGDARWVGPIGALKLAGSPILPLAWVRDRRGLLGGIALTLIAISISIALSPDLWREWIALLAANQAPIVWWNLGAAVPLLPRLIVAMALGVAAIRWVRLAPLAVVLGMPVVWLTTLSILAATPLDLGRSAKGVANATVRDSHGQRLRAAARALVAS